MTIKETALMMVFRTYTENHSIKSTYLEIRTRLERFHVLFCFVSGRLYPASYVCDNEAICKAVNISYDIYIYIYGTIILPTQNLKTHTSQWKT